MHGAEGSIHHEILPLSAYGGREILDWRLIVALLLALSIYLICRSQSQKHQLQGIPEFRGTPILGGSFVYLTKGMPGLLKGLIETGDEGISYTDMMGNRVVSVHEETLTREVLSLPEEIASREGGPSETKYSPFCTLRRLIGDNLFSHASPETQYRRNLFIKEFNNNKANSEKFEDIRRIAEWHVESIAGTEGTGFISNTDHLVSTFAVSMWGEVLYGNPKYHEDGQVLRLAEKIMALAGNPWSATSYTLSLFFGLVAQNSSLPSESKIRARVDSKVSESIRCLEDHELANPGATMKLIRVLSVRSGGGDTGPLSKFAMDFANLNLFGGHHSIGSIATWSFIELDRHPQRLAKLMKEIDTHDITFADITYQMQYLNAVVMEILRLYPVVHATLRIMHENATLRTGKRPLQLSAGMHIYLPILHLQTSKETWGADADCFVPERFIGVPNRENALLFPGFGPRNCVGYKFAILALKVYLMTFLKTYRFSLPECNHKMIVSTLIETDKPLAMRVTRRTG